jgi:hypothetical protein
MEYCGLSREHGLTHAEFFASLPAAIAHRPFERCGPQVVIRDGARKVVVELGPERWRKLGQLNLPSVVITITFSGFDDVERAAFLERFDLYFQRGGG